MQVIDRDSTSGQGANGTTRPTSTRGPRGRRAGKTTPARKTLKLSLDADTIENLNLHALKAGQSVSAYVQDMVGKHCNQWVVHAKPGPKGEGGREDGA